MNETKAVIPDNLPAQLLFIDRLPLASAKYLLVCGCECAWRDIKTLRQITCVSGDPSIAEATAQVDAWRALRAKLGANV